MSDKRVSEMTSAEVQALASTVGIDEPVVKVTMTVTVEMTKAQRDAYALQAGTEFVGMEIANRLRPEMREACLERPWLRWFRNPRHATLTFTKPGITGITTSEQR